ncbi:hypothetical protein QBC35DRAFT_452845 [Podospora australis]|uniref:Uncharacterized protein n=1 Tax=Podospora australis TaxID=1536484 RepID=A0AAN7AH01_9PEZI|nr:hypothetical protein QBC35DRAFT_452845 [Podospora australis]
MPTSEGICSACGALTNLNLSGDGSWVVVTPSTGDDASIAGGDSPVTGDDTPTTDDSPATGDDTPTTGDSPATGDDTPATTDDSPIAGDGSPVTGDTSSLSQSPSAASSDNTTSVGPELYARAHRLLASSRGGNSLYPGEIGPSLLRMFVNLKFPTARQIERIDDFMTGREELHRFTDRTIAIRDLHPPKGASSIWDWDRKPWMEGCTYRGKSHHRRSETVAMITNLDREKPPSFEDLDGYKFGKFVAPHDPRAVLQLLQVPGEKRPWLHPFYSIAAAFDETHLDVQEIRSRLEILKHYCSGYLEGRNASVSRS